MCREPPPTVVDCVHGILSMPDQRHAAGVRLVPIHVALIVVAYLVAYNGDVNGNLDFYHEGDRLAPVDAVLDGKLPFRDVYVQQGLGENIIKPILACELFGKSVESLRRLGENSYIYRGYLPPLGSGLCLYCCSRCCLSSCLCCCGRG